jgi:hypothetical protein
MAGSTTSVVGSCSPRSRHVQWAPLLQCFVHLCWLARPRLPVTWRRVRLARVGLRPSAPPSPTPTSFGEPTAQRGKSEPPVSRSALLRPGSTALRLVARLLPLVGAVPLDAWCSGRKLSPVVARRTMVTPLAPLTSLEASFSEPHAPLPPAPDSRQ